MPIVYGLKHWTIDKAFRDRAEAERYRDENPLEVHGADGTRTERYEVMVLEVPAIVECRTCGSIVTAKDPISYPYCKNCHYTGTAAEDILAGPISVMQESLPGYWVGVWHTGGGCMGLVVQREEDVYKEGAEYYMLTDGYSGVDHIPTEGVGIVCRYRDTEDGIFQAGIFVNEEEPIALGKAIELIKADINDPMAFEAI